MGTDEPGRLRVPAGAVAVLLERSQRVGQSHLDLHFLMEMLS